MGLKMTKAFTLWFTGLSGSGKSTLAGGVQAKLLKRGIYAEILDGDVIRTNLSKGLGFSKEDRDTNIRRIGWVSQLLTKHGAVNIVAAISPYRDVREEVKRSISDFVEVYVKCPLDVLKQRDTKGLYAKAISGEIKSFTGISDPYEEPLSPDLVIRSDKETVSYSVDRVIEKLCNLGYLTEYCETKSEYQPTFEANRYANL
jgi:adenylyl-sulfate kinase